MWDLSSPTRDRTHVPCIVRQILYHWTTREVTVLFFKYPFLFIYMPIYLQMKLYDIWDVTQNNLEMEGSVLEHRQDW